MTSRFDKTPVLESLSGLGSSALRRRRRDRSVSVPRRPPCSFGGEVSPRHGTSAMYSGRAPARAMTPDRTPRCSAAAGTARIGAEEGRAKGERNAMRLKRPGAL